VSSNDLKNYGFHFTDSFRAYYLGQILRSAVTPAGVANLLTFGGGKTLIGLGVAEAQAIFNQTVTNGNSLYRAQLRSVAGQQASLHVGDKFPILTAGFVGRVDPSQGQVFTPPPAFTFADLGLTLKVTPFVHSMGEVSLNVETSFEVLTGDSVNDIPIIGRRALNAQVRLQSGEWAVIGGIMGVTKSKAISGYPGLIQIPGLGYLFRKTSSADTESNVLIGLRPRLLSLPPDQIITQALRVGSDLRPYTPF
ncbi:MAG: type and secretion system protein, partial [Bryobacterales bacterium]|nr:type and secretion system protein [Bryobacterales bacterium]